LLSDETILSNINEEFKTNSYDKVFLMTDDNNSLNFFKQELGNTLIHTNSTRGDSQVGLHFSNLPNKTKLAEEVITDSVLLSLTDFKLVTRSNVSTFSLIYNLNENFRYMDKHIHYS
jgi:predicted amino acid racemase